MTPSIHYDHDVTLKIKIEVSSESGTETISGVTEPIISQRVVDQTIRLREGEASILGGIQNKQEQNNWTGIPGLSAIPILKYIFGSKDHIIQDDDIVFVVVPHVVRSQELDQANLRVIDTGEGQSIDLRHNDQGTAVPTVAPVVRPAALEHPEVGTLPSQSAIAAAPEMLAQLRAETASGGSSAAVAQAAVPPPSPATPSAPAPAPASPSASLPAPAAPATPPAAGASFALNAPAGPMSAGASFQVPVVLNGGADTASIALQMHYDSTKIMLVNVAAGNFLSRDGQAASVIHTDDPVGNLTIVASRPPGIRGVSGAGVVCVLTFQAKTAGPSELAITRVSVVNSAQQQLPAEGAQASIVVK
jgi:general secretion pathway protein D